MHGSVTVHMNASPDTVWGVVSDITRTPEFSPEVFESKWVAGATGPALGAKFKGHVKRNEKGPVYWTLCKVTHCEPGRDFGFVVLAGKKPINNWRYELAPSGDGTDVTESFRMAASLPTRVYWTLFGWARGRRNLDDMRRTLEKMKAAIEAGA